MDGQFQDRRAAGRALAPLLRAWSDRPDVVVLGLPRGGVPTAFEVARKLRAPLDVMVVRKLGLPGQPELAMGAIASGGVEVRNEDVIAQGGITDVVFHEVARREQVEVERRERLYRGRRAPIPLAGVTAIIVDDGIATGATARAAVSAARQQHARVVVLAAPVIAADTVERLRGTADAVIAVLQPVAFWSVGGFYRDFHQTTDDEVRDLLAQAAERPPAKPSAA